MTFTQDISATETVFCACTGTAIGRASAAQQMISMCIILNSFGLDPGRYCPTTSIVFPVNSFLRLSSFSPYRRSVTSSATLPSAARGRYCSLPSSALPPVCGGSLAFARALGGAPELVSCGSGGSHRPSPLNLSPPKTPPCVTRRAFSSPLIFQSPKFLPYSPHPPPPTLSP